MDGELAGDPVTGKADLAKVSGDIGEIDPWQDALAGMRKSLNQIRWLLTVALVVGTAEIVTFTWYAARIDANLARLEARSDRVDASIDRVLEQTRPVTPAAKVP
jgi:hypothetical protein